jgi:hypothetical protein
MASEQEVMDDIGRYLWNIGGGPVDRTTGTGGGYPGVDRRDAMTLRNRLVSSKWCVHWNDAVLGEETVKVAIETGIKAGYFTKSGNLVLTEPGRIWASKLLPPDGVAKS